MSTLKVQSVQHASAASPAITLDANGQATLNGLAFPTSGSLSGRNRIINGDMRIDQRNAGAAVTNGAFFAYSLDRWSYGASQASKFTIQQNAGGVTPPASFTNYLGVTSLSAYSLAAGDYFLVAQYIEGFNFADMAWGTANAQSVTLSFRVYSSLAGTFGGVFKNNASNRSYPFTYSVPSTNTWTTITLTVPGDTSGTWVTNNGNGCSVVFGLGVGSTFSGPAGAWAAANYISATGATSVVGTNGATFYITGVQLEAGTVATPFERRSYGQELSLCQRYFCKSYNIDVAPGTNTTVGPVTFYGSSDSSGNVVAQFAFPVSMRAAPTIILYRINGTSGVWDAYRSGATYTPSMSVYRTGTSGSGTYGSVASGFVPANIEGHWTASIEL